MQTLESISESVSLLSSEDMIEKAYSGLFAVMDTVKISKKSGKIEATLYGGEGRDMTHFYALVDGVYMPGVTRCYWRGRFDKSVDSLPQSGCVYVSPNTEEGVTFSYESFVRLNKRPKKILFGCHDIEEIYRCAHVSFFNNLPHPVVHISCFGLDHEGCAHAGIDTRMLRGGGGVWGMQWDKIQGEHWGPGALSLVADRKYLWNVRVEEPIKGKTKAKVDFGVDSEMIKSLAYARLTPLTESGRLRPILHWVSSHKRRISENIEINILKHLRGIESFEMGGLHFRITQPVKEQKREKATQQVVNQTMICGKAN